jgi:hypothetical protein
VILSGAGIQGWVPALAASGGNVGEVSRNYSIRERAKVLGHKALQDLKRNRLWLLVLVVMAWGWGATFLALVNSAREVSRLRLLLEVSK